MMDMITVRIGTRESKALAEVLKYLAGRPRDKIRCNTSEAIRLALRWAGKRLARRKAREGK